MQVIVSDSSALIDLRKGGLIEAFLALPHELVIPDVLLEDELLRFTEQDLAAMRQRMTIASLEGAALAAAIALYQKSPALSVNDCFAFQVAKERLGSVLLTGDQSLRRLAASARVEVHGVLWAVDEIAQHETTTRRVLLQALEIWHGDPRVRLPRAELGRLLAKFR